MTPVERLPTRIDLLGLEASLDQEPLVRRLSRATSIPCRWAGRLARADLPVIEGRAQVDADGVLELLDSIPADDETALIGITERDLATPLFTYVFGRARLGGNVAVVSMARLAPEHYGLPPDRDLTLRRTVSEILHEVGHTIGLPHCEDSDCLMSFAADVATVDLREPRLCRACADELPRRPARA